MDFEIDTSAPDVSIGVVTQGGSYATSQTPTVTIADAATWTVTLNGSPYTTGTPIGEGTWTIEASATDEFGRTTTSAVDFEIDTSPPDVTIGVVTQGGSYATSQTPTVTIADAATWTVTLNGYPYTTGTPIGEGTWTIEASATDEFGRTTTAAVDFTIDITAPDAPLGLAATAGTSTITLAWSSSTASDVVGYVLYRSLSPTGPFEPVAGPLAVLGFEDTTVTAGITYYYVVVAVDAAGLESAQSNISSALVPPGSSQSPTGTPAVPRLAGPDRVDTAIEISKDVFGSADTVIIARQDVFADALAASGLAASYRAPLLLTSSTSLTQRTADEIRRLGARDVVVLGQKRAISPGVATALSRMGLNVTRVGGADRYATAVLIAKRIQQREGSAFSKVSFLARGEIFPDALALSPLAYQLKAPILLTRSDVSTGVTGEYLRTTAFETMIVAGGEDAVSADVERGLAAAASVSTLRLGGVDRYDTAVKVSEYGVAKGWAKWRSVGIASGEDFPDALAGGIGVGARGGVLMITPPPGLHPSVAAALTAHKADIAEVLVFGGGLALDPQVDAGIRTALGL